MNQSSRFTVQSVRSTSPTEGDITLIDDTSGQEHTMQAAESANGWKLTSLMTGESAPPIKQLQGMIAAMNAGAEELRSGKIQTLQQLQQLFSRLAPQ